MKRHSSTQARQHLSELLDAADRGEPVIIERRGVRYSLSAAKAPAKRKRTTPIFDVVDRALASGQWTWESGDEGLRFVARPRRR